MVIQLIRLILNFNEPVINNQDPHSQIDNDEVPGAEYPNKNDPEYTKTNKNFQFSTLCQECYRIMKLQKNSLSSKQREAFNVVHSWDKDYVNHDGYNVELVHVFFAGI